MANPSVVINSVTYSNCPEVDIPKSGGRGKSASPAEGNRFANSRPVKKGKGSFKKTK